MLVCCIGQTNYNLKLLLITIIKGHNENGMNTTYDSSKICGFMNYTDEYRTVILIWGNKYVIRNSFFQFKFTKRAAYHPFKLKQISGNLYGRQLYLMYIPTKY